jgi:hypothetical protein
LEVGVGELANTSFDGVAVVPSAGFIGPLDGESIPGMSIASLDEVVWALVGEGVGGGARVEFREGPVAGFDVDVGLVSIVASVVEGSVGRGVDDGDAITGGKLDEGAGENSGVAGDGDDQGVETGVG